MRVLIMMLLVGVGSARGQADRTDEIVGKAIAAMGGLERIHALHSLVFKGFHYEGAYRQEYAGSKSSNAVLVRMRPGMRLVGCRPEVPGCNGQWGRIVESFDGTHGWELNWPKQRLVRTVNKAEQALKCGAAFDYLFIDYKERGFKAAYLGQKELLGRRMEAVQVVRDDCQQTTVYYFDPVTFDLSMSEMVIPIHARGDAVDMVSISKEFKTVNGVKLISRAEEVNVKTGDVIAGGEWTSIEANTIPSAEIFKQPEVHPTGITAVVLAMLSGAERSTPEQMMKLYNDFRKSDAGRNADVAYDMNWLGFELLKVDRYEYALPVFQQMIAENPNSGDVYTSLGEAYLQKKDYGEAIKAFQRAVDLGVKDEEVKKKLARLRAGTA